MDLSYVHGAGFDAGRAVGHLRPQLRRRAARIGDSWVHMLIR
jgi:hypothetical protein